MITLPYDQELADEFLSLAEDIQGAIRSEAPEPALGQLLLILNEFIDNFTFEHTTWCESWGYSDCDCWNPSPMEEICVAFSVLFFYLKAMNSRYYQEVLAKMVDLEGK